MSPFYSFNEEAAADLLKWFREYGVAYPWADSPDPWGIWVSEVMLQQTTVRAVEPRYRRWMERFPTPESLAAADEEEVLREWEGLGYYNRARNLSSAARELPLSYGDRIPEDPAELRRLHGIGEYIAAAVASFAFGKRVAAIDANGKRIAQRLSAREKWNRELESAFRNTVVELMPLENPGEMNAAIMQLGQIICTSRAPRCPECPLASCCAALVGGIQNSIPVRRRQEVIRTKTKVAILLDRGMVLIQKRESGIGRGLWVFPAESDIEDLKIGWRLEEFLPEQVHAYTKFRETLESRVYRRREGAAGMPYEWLSDVLFVSMEKLLEMPMPTAYRRIAASLPEYID
ncbi:MAG: A/G-specific adenine glycosylase [Spirochaetes bacterium]|nr:MAG: A/G-specific adenine glycosylase [Spirochaetota bacterium]